MLSSQIAEDARHNADALRRLRDAQRKIEQRRATMDNSALSNPSQTANKAQTQLPEAASASTTTVAQPTSSGDNVASATPSREVFANQNGGGSTCSSLPNLGSASGTPKRNSSASPRRRGNTSAALSRAAAAAAALAALTGVLEPKDIPEESRERPDGPDEGPD